MGHTDAMTLQPSLLQASFPEMCLATAAIHKLAHSGNVEERGAIFTRREVVDFLLDLTGYTADRPIHNLRLLEPSFGGGDFLLPAIDRLLSAWRSLGSPTRPLEKIGDSVRAVELHHDTYARTRADVIARLVGADMTMEIAVAIADRWLVQGDFLLADLPGAFDVVIGNPPYVRQELIPDALLAEYRKRYVTMYDRADLYVPFIERSLHSLAAGGALGFICADRWMKNRYGGPLRALVAKEFHLKVHVDMTDTPAFHAEVTAYPAITVITREKPGPTRIAHRPAIDSATLTALARELLADRRPTVNKAVRELTDVAFGSEPWILAPSDQLAIVRRLEERYPSIEDAGCKVGIGVATGADKAFIGRFDELDVEDDRKLPLAMTRDIMNGTVEWRGLGVVNPFADGTGLVNLADYPRLRAYLQHRKQEIIGRHCAQKVPANWYRTIDRITPSLASRPKLLIPDIKGSAHIVFEGGALYPHHNLYFVVSNQWELRALQAVLMSGIARLFIATYSTRMRGGFLRFQAQYLRRIRLPLWQDVDPRIRSDLKQAALARDVSACNQAAYTLYGLSDEERSALDEMGNQNGA